MAAIKSIAPKSSRGSLNVDPTELTGADTLVYDRTKWQTLYIRNESVGSVTITLDGDTVDDVFYPGQGGPIDNSAGYVITVPAGEVHAVALPNIKSFLNQDGTASAVTGGAADVFAWIQEG